MQQLRTVGRDGGQDDGEDGVGVERPEEKLAEDYNRANGAGQVEEPLYGHRGGEKLGLTG